MQKNKIKLIILDAYGPVITGGYPATCKYLGKIFKKNWKDVFQIVYRKYFNMAAERKITQQEAWEEAIKELNMPISVKKLKKIHYDFMDLNKPVIKYVKQNNLSGAKILLLSKNTRSQFYDVNKKTGFRKEFKYIINTWELGLPKASKETMELIKQKFKVQSEEILYTDDQEENLIEAKKMGIKTIFYQNFNQFKKEFKKYE